MPYPLPYAFRSFLCRSCCLLLTILTLVSPLQVQAGQTFELNLGARNDFAYLSELLETVLTEAGHQVRLTRIADVPTTRLERMLEDGQVSAMMLGKTPARSRRFLQVKASMTDGLMNHRILFIPKGEQHHYTGVETLADFRQTGQVAGMGADWRDYLIWKRNDLPVEGISGDWRKLYRMVASGDRGIDYLPRGAHEMASEWQQHPELDVEENLVLVYPGDHILYVSPQQPDLYRVLRQLLPAAEQSGLIARLVEKHFPEVFQPPVNLNQRRFIRLEPVE